MIKEAAERCPRLSQDAKEMMNAMTKPLASMQSAETLVAVDLTQGVTLSITDPFVFVYLDFMGILKWPVLYLVASQIVSAKKRMLVEVGIVPQSVDLMVCHVEEMLNVLV